MLIGHEVQKLLFSPFTDLASEYVRVEAVHHMDFTRRPH